MQAEDWQRRYSEQALWTAQARSYVFARINLPAEARVLEVGCGTGALLASLTAAYQEKGPALNAARGTSFDLHGLDINLPYLKLAGANVPTSRLVCGDGLRFPYPPGSFDACCCHFFLLWVDAAAALREMVRVTRPGGWVLALAEPDYAGRIDYPAELSQIGRLQARSLRRQGAEPNMGRLLAGLFRQAGLTDIFSGVIGGEWTCPRSLDSLESEWQVIHADLHDLASKKDLRDWYLLDRAASADGSRVLYVPVFYAAGRVPPD